MTKRLSVTTAAAGMVMALAGMFAATPQAAAQGCRAQPVIMIATSWCGYCRKARAFFNAYNVEFEEIDAERTQSPGIRETYRRTGVPLIIVGAEEVHGFDERRLRRLLCIGS